jgi:type IV secretory pathway VirB2 component (pilin)
MNQASKRTNRLLATLTGAATAALWPQPAQAAGGYGFPWDQPLLSLQQTLTGTVAPSLVWLSLLGALFAYAIGGDSEIARRLGKAALGVSVALGLLHFMNYLLP